jgi:hypothetical protein
LNLDQNRAQIGPHDDSDDIFRTTFKNDGNNDSKPNPIVSVEEFFTAEHIPTHDLLANPCLPIIGVKRLTENPNIVYYYCN